MNDWRVFSQRNVQFSQFNGPGADVACAATCLLDRNGSESAATCGGGERRHDAGLALSALCNYAQISPEPPSLRSRQVAKCRSLRLDWQRVRLRRRTSQRAAPKKTHNNLRTHKPASQPPNSRDTNESGNQTDSLTALNKGHTRVFTPATC